MEGGLPFEVRLTSEGEYILAFNSPLTYDNAGAVWEGLNSLIREDHPSSLVIDLGATPRIDSAGIALLRSIERMCERLGLNLRIESMPPSAGHFLTLIEKKEPPPPEKPHITTSRVITKLGFLALHAWDEVVGFYRFCREFIALSARDLYHTRRFRWNEMLYYLELTGANAMSIVFLLSFLLGMVMAFQAAVQLRQFGANIYVADLLSLALTRELAPVFTAIIIAGRSGSAFAAEIGTMKVNEELDALEVMGFNLAEFITMPKVIALMIAGPLLTMWANFSGIMGGMVVGILTLDLTSYGFMSEIFSVLSVKDIMTGLIKSEIFAMLVGLIGCFRGFETGTGADSVGRQTTSAVVSGIFAIIFADAIFTVIFHSIGW